MNKLSPLIDPFNRTISYLRVSVTDRCDFRCVYCMSEKMKFLPKKDVLTLEELDRVCSVFIEMGIKKIRITGGEPLVRRNILSFFKGISRHLISGALSELTLTTNGSQLKRFAKPLTELGVKRVNISLDTLDPEKFKKITRWGRLDQVLEGIKAAKAIMFSNMCSKTPISDAATTPPIQLAKSHGNLVLALSQLDFNKILLIMITMIHFKSVV